MKRMNREFYKSRHFYAFLGQLILYLYLLAHIRFDQAKILFWF